MVFTQNSDIYAAIHDKGINRVLRHLMRQRPSWFNYSTSGTPLQPRVCTDISAVPEVRAFGNPLATIMSSFQIPMTHTSLNFCAQVTGAKVDFHPGGIFPLPPELGPPLSSQRFALQVTTAAGLLCPVVPDGIAKKCFSLSLYAKGNAAITGAPGSQHIKMGVDGIEIPELKPDGMEEALECYALYILGQEILPKCSDIIAATAFKTISLPSSLGSLKISAATNVPHNPAIEDNQFKAFVNLDEVTINVPLPSGTSPGTSGTVTRTTRARARTGTFDLTAAVSSAAFRKIFMEVVKTFRFQKSGSVTSGNFTISYQVAAHLEGGTFEMRDDGRFVIKELDIIWTTLKIGIGVDIPEICLGGDKICITPIGPFPCTQYCPIDCVTLPKYCFFTPNPDFVIPVDLSGLVRSEISVSVELGAYYGIGSGIPNRWQVVATPELPIDIDIIDIADTVGDLFKTQVEAAINASLEAMGAPEPVRDAVKAILGGIEQVLRDTLDIPDDIGEWLLDELSNTGIFLSIADELYDYITGKMPAVYELENPFPLPLDLVVPTPQLIPVKVPIAYIGIRTNSHEMILEGDIGD